MKLQRKHIAEQWQDSDGYWIALRSGWKWNGDPVGAVHCIHEDNRKEAFAQGVLPCRCTDCVADRTSLPE